MHAAKICGAIKVRSGDLDLRGFNLTRGFYAVKKFWEFLE